MRACSEHAWARLLKHAGVLLSLLVLCAPHTRAAPPIGYVQVHSVLEPSHQALLQDAYAAHKAGNYARAASLLERLIGAAPGYQTPVYNLACALAKQGELARAHELLSGVLRTDLVGFERVYRGDDDFAALRKAPEGKRLEREIEELRAAYRRMVSAGVPAVRVMVRVPASRAASEDLSFQPGIYHHASKSFVPLAPEREAPYGSRPSGSSLLSAEHEVAVGIRAASRDLLVFAGTAPSDREGSEHRFSTPSARLEVAAAESGAWWRDIGSESHAHDPRDVAWHFLPVENGRSAPQSRGPGDGARLRLLDEGTLLVFASRAHRLDDRIVHTARGPVLLSAGHARAVQQWVVPAPSGQSALAISISTCRPHTSGCSKGGHAHAIDIIEGGSAREWLHGAGWAMARFERSGAVYVQLSSETSWGTLRRYAKPGARFEAVMQGVLLVAGAPESTIAKGEPNAPEPSQAETRGLDPWAIEQVRPAY